MSARFLRSISGPNHHEEGGNDTDIHYEEFGDGPPLQQLAVAGRITDAVEHFFRWASSRTSGGNAYDGFGPALQAALRDSAPALLGERRGGTGAYLTPELIGKVECPVTCLLGDLTNPVLAGGTDRIVGVLPQAELVPIAGAGHALPFDQPEKFAAAVRAACRPREESPR